MIQHEVNDMDDIYLVFVSFSNPEWGDRLRALQCAEHNESANISITGKFHEDGSGDFDPTVIIEGCCQPFIDETLSTLRSLNKSEDQAAEN
jgi:hypothetical protein